jgi:hypothetical protein
MEVGYLKSIWITILAIFRGLKATWEAWKTPRKLPWTPPPAFPKTHAVGSTPRVWNNRYLGLAFFKLTHYPRKRMFPSQWKMP